MKHRIKMCFLLSICVMTLIKAKKGKRKKKLQLFIYDILYILCATHGHLYILRNYTLKAVLDSLWLRFNNMRYIVFPKKTLNLINKGHHSYTISFLLILYSSKHARDIFRIICLCLMLAKCLYNQKICATLATRNFLTKTVLFC